MSRQLLFKVTKKDLVVDTFRSGGAGGQHQNRRNSGVRIKHPASGAIGESRNERSQHQNRRIALQRLADSRKFKLWVRLRAAEIMMGETVEKRVEKLMSPENLVIENRVDGRWRAV
jgi:peptide chain release factor 1